MGEGLPSLALSEYYDDDTGVDEVIAPAILKYLHSDGCCLYPSDRALISLIKDDLRRESYNRQRQDMFSLEVQALLKTASEDKFWEWASHGVYRPLALLDLSDTDMLRRGFAEYADRLRTKLHEALCPSVQDSIAA